jgi:hypothetical protein
VLGSTPDASTVDLVASGAGGGICFVSSTTAFSIAGLGPKMFTTFCSTRPRSSVAFTGLLCVDPKPMPVSEGTSIVSPPTSLWKFSANSSINWLASATSVVSADTLAQDFKFKMLQRWDHCLPPPLATNGRSPRRSAPAGCMSTIQAMATRYARFL